MRSQVAERQRRAVGTKAGLDLDRIIEAARTVPAERLTMQAVASVLGVDRSALNHHVSSRKQLLKLVAQASFIESFAEVHLPSGGSWQEATRAYVRAYAEAMHATGPLAEHLTDDIRETQFLRATEALLQTLVHAGFTSEFSVRFLVLVGYVARGHARDRVEIEQGLQRSRAENTQDALAARDPGDYPLLDEVSAHPFDTYGDTQLETALRVVVEGAAAVLDGR